MYFDVILKKYALLLLSCLHIGLLFGKRLATSSDSKISGFTRPYVIGFVEDLFFPSLESGMRVDRSRIWKGKVADSKIGTSSIDNETHDDDFRNPRRTGSRVSFSAGS